MKAFQKDENCKLLRVGFCVFFGFVFLCVNLGKDKGDRLNGKEDSEIWPGFQGDW